MRILDISVMKIVVIIAIFLYVSQSEAQAILQPTQDVIVVTFGGGEGCNVFAKYNIATVPAGMSIDTVFLTPFIISFGASWDGDANFWNVNDQNWTEGDSCNHIYGLPISNQITQASGFGIAAGWSKSVDLTDIFVVDYNAGHTYCSIKIKDPDDMTTVPMPGSMPVNAETLAVGNIIFNQHTIFYAREYPNAPPWLVVYYHSVGTAEIQDSPCNIVLKVAPNPTTAQTQITLHSHHGINRSAVCIYNTNGMLVRQFAVRLPTGNPVTIYWDGTDKNNRPVSSGTYFCVVTGEGYTGVASICLIR